MFINETDKLDQHFLVDENVINKFIEYCDLKDTDNVVEIGPGNGNITRLLCEKSKSVIAIEKDLRLKGTLDQLEKKYDNLQIVYGNVLDTYIPKCDKIITSLPYSIIEPFIKKIIKCEFNELIMIMGLNYIDEVINNSNNKLALLTNSFFKAEKLMEIGRESFAPQPRVMSGILRLVEKDLSESKRDIKEFIIRELFFYDDMKIKNGLKEGLIQYNNISQREAKDIINKLEIDEDLLEMKFEIISNKDLERLLKYLDKLYTFIK